MCLSNIHKTQYSRHFTNQHKFVLEFVYCGFDEIMCNILTLYLLIKSDQEQCKFYNVRLGYGKETTTLQE